MTLPSLTRALPLLTFAALCGCGSPSSDLIDGFTKAEWAKVMTFGPLGAPMPNSTNKYADNAAAAAFGQRLFFEKSYAGALTVGSDGTNGSLGAVGDKGKVACASCHDPNAWYVDTRSMPNNLSIGVNFTKRNSASLVNAAYYKWLKLGRQGRLALVPGRQRL